MLHFLLFMGLSLIIFGLLSVIYNRKRNIKFSTVLSLFFFGIMLAIPFILLEHLSFNIRSYVILMAFIAIELLVISIEHKWEYLHNLLHHNIKELRLLSFFIVSLGFTYSELSVYILSNTETIGHLLVALPIKAVFAMFIHTVLTSSAALLTATESIVEHVLMFFLYYIRLILISISHFLYVFFTKNELAVYLLIPFLTYNIYLLFKHKKYLDKKGEVLTI